MKYFVGAGDSLISVINHLQEVGKKEKNAIEIMQRSRIGCACLEFRAELLHL